MVPTEGTQYIGYGEIIYSTEKADTRELIANLRHI